MVNFISFYLGKEFTISCRDTHVFTKQIDITHIENQDLKNILEDEGIIEIKQ